MLGQEIPPPADGTSHQLFFSWGEVEVDTLSLFGRDSGKTKTNCARKQHVNTPRNDGHESAKTRNGNEPTEKKSHKTNRYHGSRKSQVIVAIAVNLRTAHSARALTSLFPAVLHTVACINLAL